MSSDERIFKKFLEKGSISEQKKMLLEEKKCSDKLTALLGNYCIPIDNISESDGKIYAVYKLPKNVKPLSEIINDVSFSDCTMRVRLLLIKRILELVCAFHEKKWYCLSISPGMLMVEDFDIPMGNVGKVLIYDFRNPVPFESVNERHNFNVSNKYTSPELLIHSRYDESKSVSEKSDLYSVAKIAETIIGDFNSIIANGNLILLAMLRVFISTGKSPEPEYRFESSENMLSVFENLIKENCFFEKNDYTSMFHQAYDNFFEWQECLISPDHLDKNMFEAALSNLEDQLLRVDIDKYRAEYFYKLLRELSNKYKNTITDEQKVRLAILGIRAKNNLGKSFDALEIYESVRDLETMLEEMAELSPVIASTYMDCYRYADAQKVAEENIIRLHNSNIRMEKKRILLGRSYSSKGCSMGFQHILGADESFEQALYFFNEKDNFWKEIFESRNLEDSDRLIKSLRSNTHITLFHYMQYACETRRKELYGALSDKYFIGKEWTERLKAYISNKDIWKNYYEIYILLKGIYCFYPEVMCSSAFYDEIQKMYDLEFEKEKMFYPLSLIELYLALIEIKVNGSLTENAEKLFKQALTHDNEVKKGNMNIQTAIWYRIYALYNDVKDETDKNKRLLKRLMILCRRFGWADMYSALEKDGKLIDFLRFEVC